MKNNKRRFLQFNKLVKQLIICFLLISLVPLTVVTSLVYSISSTTEKKDITNHLTVVAQSKANRIENFILDKQQNIAALSQLPNIVEAIDKYQKVFEEYGINSQEYSSLNREKKPLFDNYLEKLGYENLLLVSQKGEVVFSADTSPILGTNLYENIDYKDSELAKVFDLSKTLMQVEISNYDYYELTEEPVIFIASPIFKDKLIVGVVIFQINNQELYRVVNDYTGLGRTGETMIGIEAENQIIFITPTRHDRTAAFERTIDIDSNKKHPLTLAANGIRGEGDFIDYRGKESIAVWRFLPSLNAGIVVKIDRREAMASLITNRNIIISLGTITTLIVIMAAILTARSISDPVVQLTKGARNIARGQLNKGIKIKRTDELGELATSFNKMACQLKESFSTLEQRIEERTISLKKAVIEAEAAKEEAIAANKAKDNFLVNISHELRSPLNSILGYTKLILESKNLETSQILSLRIVKQSGSHLLTLINDLLDFSKSKAGKMQLNLTQFDLLEFIEVVVSIVEMQARENGLLFKYQVIGDLPKGIIADEQRLRQILLNLLTNAVKFTDRGEVFLRVKQIDKQNDRSQIRFEVIDTGVGISPTMLEKIFQPFEQVGNLKNRTGGTGLGLSISQELAYLMGSKIEVKSKLNHGSIFYFDVTFDEVELTPIENNIEPEQGRIIGYKGERQAKILVVDDRLENRLLLLNLLEPKGFKVIEASNGKEGLEKACQIQPDLILTDLLMPVKTGLTMVLELRKMPEFQDIPIISLSASNSDIMGKQSLSVGCNAFLPKPFEEENLYALLQKYLDLKWIFEDSVLTSSSEW